MNVLNFNQEIYFSVNLLSVNFSKEEHQQKQIAWYFSGEVLLIGKNNCLKIRNEYFLYCS
jgi:hypothetical protein